MPRAKRAPNPSARPNPSERRKPLEIPPLALWFIRDILPLLRQRRHRSSKKTRQHLKNAGIELLEAMRTCIDETIEWLREEEKDEPMRRIEVEE
jgi:hypothetical protein